MGQTITIRKVPEDVRRTMKARAAAKGMSLSAYMRERLAEIAERPSVQEWEAQFSTSASTKDGQKPSDP